MCPPPASPDPFICSLPHVSPSHSLSLDPLLSPSRVPCHLSIPCSPTQFPRWAPLHILPHLCPPPFFVTSSQVWEHPVALQAELALTLKVQGTMTGPWGTSWTSPFTPCATSTPTSGPACVLAQAPWLPPLPTSLSCWVQRFQEAPEKVSEWEATEPWDHGQPSGPPCLHRSPWAASQPLSPPTCSIFLTRDLDVFPVETCESRIQTHPS